MPFRVTRLGDTRPEDGREVDDLLESVEAQLLHDGCLCSASRPGPIPRP